MKPAKMEIWYRRFVGPHYIDGRCIASFLMLMLALATATWCKDAAHLINLGGMLAFLTGDFTLAKAGYLEGKKKKRYFLGGGLAFALGHVIFASTYILAPQRNIPLAMFIAIALNLFAFPFEALTALVLKKKKLLHGSLYQFSGKFAAYFFFLSLNGSRFICTAAGVSYVKLALAILATLSFLLSDILIKLENQGRLDHPGEKLLKWVTYVTPVVLLLVLL